MANSLVNVANSMNIKTTAVISQMNDPLGRCIGNSLEGDLKILLSYFSKYLDLVKLMSYFCGLQFNAIFICLLHLVFESLQCLRGDGPIDLEELVVKQGGIEFFFV